MAKPKVRRAIIREWMALARGKRQSGQQALAFAKAAVRRDHGERDLLQRGRQFATFHGDNLEPAAPVLETVCNQATIMEQPATTAQPPSNEVARTIEMFRPKRKRSR